MSGTEQLAHAVYRVHDAGCRLLYVGISWMPEARLKVHLRTATWADQFDHFSLDWWDGRGEALAAETRAIKREHPVFNGTHSVCRCGGTCTICMSRYSSLPRPVQHECPGFWIIHPGARVEIVRVFWPNPAGTGNHPGDLYGAIDEPISERDLWFRQYA